MASTRHETQLDGDEATIKFASGGGGSEGEGRRTRPSQILQQQQVVASTQD